jgi:hypothetical protein
MSREIIRFEDVTKAIISKKHSKFLAPFVPMKPEFEWLRDYLRNNNNKAES